MKSKDQARIEANRKKFQDAFCKKQSVAKKDNTQRQMKPLTGKFCPPTQSETKRGIIDGKPMFYLTKLKQ